MSNAIKGHSVYILENKDMRDMMTCRIMNVKSEHVMLGDVMCDTTYTLTLKCDTTLYGEMTFDLLHYSRYNEKFRVGNFVDVVYHGWCGRDKKFPVQAYIQSGVHST